MISRYVSKALERARYETVDQGMWSANVRGLPGVVAIGASVEACRQNLAEVVEDWVLVRVARHLPVPKLGGVVISVRRAG